MTIRETITNLLSHFAPLTLVKQILPIQKTCQVLTQSIHDSKPWMNADRIKLTAEDYSL